MAASLHQTPRTAYGAHTRSKLASTYLSLQPLRLPGQLPPCLLFRIEHMRAPIKPLAALVVNLLTHAGVENRTAGEASQQGLDFGEEQDHERLRNQFQHHPLH
ncbi:hypothetical protein ACFXTH_028622 [Malus domestica]